MKNIEIKSCNSCPFCYRDYNNFSLGQDTMLICTLAEYNKLNEYIIGSYNSYECCDYCNDLEQNEDFEDEKCTCNYKMIKTPDWCPIKKTGKIELIWK